MRIISWKGKKYMLVVVLAAVFLSCSSTDSHWDKTDNICGQLPCYEGPFEPPWISAYDTGVEFRDHYRRKLPCDNKVLESKNILTFSDASSDEVKIEFSRMAEVSLSEIKALFIIDSLDLGIVDLHTKITIFSNRHKNYEQHATLKGFLLMALDNPFWETWGGGIEGPEFKAYYQRVVKHEMMHVVQFMMGAVAVDVWFREGLAEYVAGGTFALITDWEEVDEWRQDPDHVNPISIHENSDYPSSASSSYYQMFRLAIRYLLDPKWHNRTIMDVKNLFLDVADGMLFADAFEAYMGMSLKYFENNFYRLIKEYLGTGQ